jgi:hypothetical protein
MNKIAFVVSVILTTVVLMAAGGIAYALRFANNIPADNPQQVESLPTEAIASTPAIDPALQQALIDREAIYQQRLAEANARLEQAQQQQLALQAQLAAAQNTVSTAPTGITPEQAAQIAADFLKRTDVYNIELITLHGQNLYKITFASGDVIYVDMSGQIVGSATAEFASNSQPASGGKGWGSQNTVGAPASGDNHDGDDHDD